MNVKLKNNIIFANKTVKQMNKNSEDSIRTIVRCYVKSFATGFSGKHLAQVDNENGVINMKIHNIFIAALGREIQYYSALARSLDSSLGNMLEGMAIEIAKKHYVVSQHVEGVLYKEQTDYIAEILEDYKNHARLPKINDYKGISLRKGEGIHKRHESDYYLVDEETGMHYLIDLNFDGNIDCSSALQHKQRMLEQYCILSNKFGEDNLKILFSTLSNNYGEGFPWTQRSVLQFFDNDELCIGKDFWNFITKSNDGFDIIFDEYSKYKKTVLNMAKSNIYTYA